MMDLHVSENQILSAQRSVAYQGGTGQRKRTEFEHVVKLEKVACMRKESCVVKVPRKYCIQSLEVILISDSHD
jgi:hypothetical protein